ncbi:MAG: chemotaxis protein CheA [Acidobacteriota bacterium]
MDKPQEKAIKDFISEAEEILESLSEDVEQAYEQFERSMKIKPDLVNKIFREMHSLKGLASMMSLEKITTVSHDMESLLDKVRMGKIKFSKEIFSILDETKKVLRNLVVDVGKGEEKTDPVPLLEKIAIAMGAEPAKAQPTQKTLKLSEETLKSLTEYEEHRLKENLEEGNKIYGIKVGFDFSDFDTRLRALTESLNNNGEVISTLPLVEPALPEGIHFRLLFGTELEQKAVEALVSPANGEVESLIETSVAPQPDKKEASSKKEEISEEIDDKSQNVEQEEGQSFSEEAEDIKGISNSVKVDIAKLDEVMGLVGELGIIKSSFKKIAEAISGKSELEDLHRDLTRQLRSMEKKLEDLQRSIIDIRMVPIGQIFSKLNRTARRIARGFGKEVTIEMYGGETELDKRIMDELVTPLVHIIRNAIDHGLETSSERLKIGKPTEGLLSISAYHRGNAIVIEVTDDGRGLDYEKIRASAVKKGIVGESVVLSPEECLELIFQPGFSSSDKVTEVSGRGVGLDVVKTTVERLKGSISVWTEKGKGTTFQIILPITLAIIQSLIVKCANQNFAIPISSIIESFKIKESDIEYVDQREVYNLRGITLPILRLESRFDLKRGETKKENDLLFVVVAKRGDRAAGIVVDDLVGEQETVIHPIGKKLGSLPGIAGATEVGENQVILVIDTSSLLAPIEAVRV